MSLLDHPEAQALLSDAVLLPETVRDCADGLTGFLQRYLPKFYRVEQRENATLVIRGLLSGLERKTCEPIAIQAGLPREPIQFFVGAGKWDDEAVMTELRRHVVEELAVSDGVVVIDPSAFPKKGTESCGVDRQWCGRLGKVENCQVGVFLAYAAAAGYAPLDRQLYLPEEWAADEVRRERCHVPPEIQFQEKWRIALDLLDRSLPGLPHGWIVGDDEFGRASEFRAELRRRHERYVLDVPCNTLVRDLERRPPRRRRAGRGRKPKVPFQRVDAWARSQPDSRWVRLMIRDAEKGPLEVDALTVRVQTKQDGRAGPDDWRETYIDLLFARDGVERRLRFFAPREVEIPRGVSGVMGSWCRVYVADVRGRQMEGIGVRVGSFEPDWCVPSFWAASVIEVTEPRHA